MPKGIALTILGLLTTMGGCAFNRFKHERVEQRELETSPLTGIQLSTFNGNVKFVAHDDPAVLVEITYRAYGEDEQTAEANCAALDCDVSADNGILTLQAIKPSNQWSAAVGFVVHAPRDCSLDLKSSNGKITAEGFPNGVKAHTSNGTIELARIGTSVDASTSNGTIRIHDAYSPVKLSTSNGRIEFSGAFVGTENQLKTSNGRIELWLAEDQLTEVNARTSNGSIKSDLPIYESIKEKKREFHGVVGRVGNDAASLPTPSVQVKTSNGSIRIGPATMEQAEQETEVESASEDAEVTSEEIVL